LQAELARAEVADLCRFSENIDALTVRIVRRVKDLGSTLPTLPGCAELTAAKLILEAANVDRFPNESGFARYAGLAPIPAWSGSTIGRMRVCPFGNRQINTAIHRIAVVQLRLDCPGRAYYRRRRAEGDSGAKPYGSYSGACAGWCSTAYAPMTWGDRGESQKSTDHRPPSAPGWRADCCCR